MRVGFVTQWFPPEPAIVPEAIARGLAGQGHTVDVVTGFPNYPTGTVMAGYRVRPYQHEVLAPGVAVHRAPLWPNHDSNPLRRMGNYLSFAAGASLAVRTHVSTPDVWLVYSSPATSAIPTLRLLRRHRRPVFLLIQDLWPDSVTGSGFVNGGVNTTMTRALNAFCSATYRQASGIGVISPGMREMLMERGVPDQKIHYTPNWIDDAHLLPGHTADSSMRDALGLPRGRLWMYAGNLGDLQGLDGLLEMFASTPKASLVLVGEGVARERLERRVRESGAANISILPAVPTEQVGHLIAASDVQVVSLADTPLLRVTMPSKVQSAMAAGRPILVHAAGDAAKLVVENECGWAVSPGDSVQGAKAIEAGLAASDTELAALGSNARGVYDAQFSTGVGPSRLAAALESLART